MARLERRRKHRNPDEREKERVKRGQVHIGKHHQWAVVVWDLVVASYSHEDSGMDKGLVEERNILNFWI